MVQAMDYVYINNFKGLHLSKNLLYLIFTGTLIAFKYFKISSRKEENYK